MKKTATGIRGILERLRGGKLSMDKAFTLLKDLPYEDIGYARIDHHRSLRKGSPEVIFAPGKEPAQVLGIARRIHARGEPVLVTRAQPSLWKTFQRRFPKARYDRLGRLITLTNGVLKKKQGLVLVVTAGTGDIPVASEAAATAGVLGSRVRTLYDVGVAGLHRLLDHKKLLDEARVIVVVCGMEGALPSVIGGLARAPVIAVPTSIGYGAHLGGFAPLLSILNSCAPGVVCVNIDNGFGAGYFANLINRMVDD